MMRAHLVEVLIATHRFRSREIGEDLFGDPAWDILLDLYNAETRNLALSSSNVGRVAGIAQTTALRWLSILEHRGLIVRKVDRTDGRRTNIFLSDKGRDCVERSLDHFGDLLSAARTSWVPGER